jgi:ribosome-binding factor A
MNTKLKDPRISPLASVTRVEVSRDLQVAKVYVSVLSGPKGSRRSPPSGHTTLIGLNHALGHIQSLVARQIAARRCPEIRFVLDESLKKAAEAMRIIDQNAADGPMPVSEQRRATGAGETSQPLDDDRSSLEGTAE